MRHILVLNAKGGCGKSTLATNIASYFASDEEKKVALVDYDPQASSLDWLARRPDTAPEIIGFEGFKSGMKGMPRDVEVCVMDAPARSHGPELTDLLRHADTVIIPVLPSTIDMQACARFIEELKKHPQVKGKKVKLAVIANRIKENTLIFEELDGYLSKLKVPYIGGIREAQNYIRAYTRGLGVAELPAYLAWPDWDQWEPVMTYLKSKRSQP